MKRVFSLLRKIYNMNDKNILAFMQKVNEKACSIGMSNSHFSTPSGIGNKKYNTTTARDLLKLVLALSQNKILDKIWRKKTIYIHTKGNHPRVIPIESTLKNAEVGCTYQLVAGKTGSWANIFHLAAITEMKGVQVIGIVLNANTDTNRFKAVEELFTISSAILSNSDMKPKTDSVLYAQSAISCIIHGDAYEVLFEQNADDEHLSASLTKLITAITALDYITNTQELLQIQRMDLVNDLHISLIHNDIITVSDALYAMLLPSSNQAATALARMAGKQIRKTKKKTR